MIKKAIYSVALCAVLGGAFVAGSLHNSHNAVSAASTDPRRPLYYRCPMHPTYTSDKPGIAPCCGMELEPVYAVAAPAQPVPATPLSRPARSSSASLQQQLIGVRVEAAERSAAPNISASTAASPRKRRASTSVVGLDGYIRDRTGHNRQPGSEGPVAGVLLHRSRGSRSAPTSRVSACSITR